MAFDLGLEWADPSVDVDSTAGLLTPGAGASCPMAILFDYSRLARPHVIVFTHKLGGAYVNPAGRVACSRRRNFHFDRPDKSLIGCYYAALGCPKAPTEGLNPAKQSGLPAQYCGERSALRHLFKGPAETLKKLFPIFQVGGQAGRGFGVRIAWRGVG
jgi:hypothetical protein